MPHAHLERYEIDQELPIDDPVFNMDYYYVLKGGLQIELELGQV